MRVIAGSARRLNLMTPKGRAVRPTTDRIKETLFNMIQSEVPGSRFLDLFAGSGGIGIEALSRGAQRCVFADSSRDSAACIRANLDHTGLTDRSLVMLCDYRRALSRLSGRERFDIVFLDPPYQQNLEREALQMLDSRDLVADDGLIIIESVLGEDFTDSVPDGYIVERIKEYKTNQHVFLRKENKGI